MPIGDSSAILFPEKRNGVSANYYGRFSYNFNIYNNPIVCAGAQVNYLAKQNIIVPEIFISLNHRFDY